MTSRSYILEGVFILTDCVFLEKLEGLGKWDNITEMKKNVILNLRLFIFLVFDI